MITYGSVFVRGMYCDVFVNLSLVFQNLIFNLSSCIAFDQFLSVVCIVMFLNYTIHRVWGLC